MSQGGGEKGALEPQQVESSRTVRMAAEMLDCDACHRPLKPPIFKCDGVHLLCSSCRGGHGQACGLPVAHSTLAEAFAVAAFVICDYQRYGCDPGHVVYHEAANHRTTCQHAPCGCPERCGFSSSPVKLLKHITGPAHSMKIIVVRYGRPGALRLPLSVPWHVLVGEEEKAERHRNLFLLSVGDRGAEVEVSLVCIRADAGVQSEFSCRIAVQHSDDETRQTLETPVRKTSLSNGIPAPREVKSLTVKKENLTRDIVPLTIRIDRRPNPMSPPFSPTRPISPKSPPFSPKLPSVASPLPLSPMSPPFSPTSHFSPKSPPFCFTHLFSPEPSPFSPKRPSVAPPLPPSAAQGKDNKRSKKGT